MRLTARRYLTITVALALLATLSAGVIGANASQETPAAGPQEGPLLSGSGNRARLAAALAEAPEPQQAAIYAGACDDLDDEAAFPLSDVVMQSAVGEPAAPVATSYSVVDAAIADLVAAPHAVVVATGGDPEAAVACGEFGDTVEGDDLFFGLREVNGSGYTGIGWLHASGDQTFVTLFVARDLAGAAAPTPPGPPRPPTPPPAVTETPAVEPTPRAPVAGVTYTSEPFGYSITYDDTTWTVGAGPEVEEEEGFVTDFIQLVNGTSWVNFLGVSAGLNARQCLEATIGIYEDDPVFESIEPHLDAAGDRILGGDAGDAFGAWDLTFTNRLGETEVRTFYFRCIVLRPGQSFLVITHVTGLEAYESEAPARDELLEGLTLP